MRLQDLKNFLHHTLRQRSCFLQLLSRPTNLAECQIKNGVNLKLTFARGK